ncbi:MAG: glutathione S-transferase family protein [Magnetovibrionaceae bacterium]
MLTLYDFLESGNGYKVRLVLTALGKRFRWVECNILAGETRTPEFLDKFPNGRIPAIELEDGRVLFESNAIIWYFADGTSLAPTDPYERAQTLQWMFFEQYSHEPNIAVARFWRHYVDPIKVDPDQLAAKIKGGEAALQVMDDHLADRAWFVGERFSIADVALYAYTHVAEEGGFELRKYPNVRLWLDRVAERPGHVPITQRFDKQGRA